MNPAKRAILKQSKKEDAKIKKRLSFAPSVGTEDEFQSGTEGDIESDALSPLTTKNIENIQPKSLQQRFDESARSEQAQQELDGSISFVKKRKNRSLGRFQDVQTPSSPADVPITFCPNVKRTSWGLCYKKKERHRDVTEQGKKSYKLPVVAFKENTRPEFVNAMNMNKNTALKILIVGEPVDGDGIQNALRIVAEKRNVAAEISLSSAPVAEDIKGIHYYIFLVPLERSTCPKTLSSLIPKLEKKTVCVNLKSCLLFLPSVGKNVYDSLCPKDLANLLEQYQINSYTWPREIPREELFCYQLLQLAENVRGGLLGSSNLINWGLQRLTLVDEDL